MRLYGCKLVWSAQTDPATRVEIARSLEVSLACPGCARDHRTLILSEHQSARHWGDPEHPFQGRVVTKSLSVQDGVIRANYILEYEYEPFVDPKFSPDPVSSQPSWARLNYHLHCLCGRTIEGETQHNLTRPSSDVCSCGRLLLLELEGALRFEPSRQHLE